VIEGDGLASRIETYYDAAPRTAADAETVGPFTLFVGRGAWAYYARPRLGLVETVRRSDVLTLLARQRELDVPTEIEWQPAVTPSLAAAATAAGMVVHEFRLMGHEDDAGRPRMPGLASRVRLVDATDDLVELLSAQQLGFGASETVDTGAVETLRTRIEAGLTRVAAGYVDADGRPVCVGMHNPVGDVSEVVGVSTVPAARRQGWAARVSEALVADAYALGIRTVFLSAEGDDVARIYRRVGFTDVGTVCAAELPSPTG
jgi:predicted GNAT family acetyltransferase